jgi:hypothetical protein
MGECVNSGYLSRCDDLIFEDEKKTRLGVCWSDYQIRKVEDKIGSLKYFPTMSSEHRVAATNQQGRFSTWFLHLIDLQKPLMDGHGG